VFAVYWARRVRAVAAIASCGCVGIYIVMYRSISEGTSTCADSPQCSVVRRGTRKKKRN